ncbi:cyclic-di-GMP phosphodiesterase, flagellum assembly factor TipF [Tardiphaga sp. OK246]|jgi:cyclic-di-GMP phosphodiesterase TipF (flagellum assembly factor)|uniref:EAL domain-containing protein n=1 Tax=Tardiphaga sp. OK246 TaxID=1855307 RepID=UPI000B643140|nr:EAL domain-containing protein [Tardiphaga sp. OK246]SNS29806.1 cyclic-di-GMP phosphodiesterase, flagellum assembly factor TipF [Tardiphaga sp. OK246]
MIRISTIFVGICMVLVSASLGLVLYAIAGISGYESAIVALTALTVMILYNAVSMRIKDRTESTGQITDLSRGTADLARQVAEFGRRLAVVESKIASAGTANQDRIQTVAGEIGELGALVKQLATSVATHEDMLTALPATASAAIAPPSPPVKPVTAADVPLAVEVAEDTVTPTAPAIIVKPEAAPARDNAQFTAMVKSAIADNRIDIYLQPMVTLPQRKVRFYEAMTRLRDDKDQVITADEFIGPAEAAGLMGQIDHIVLLRCMQVLRRLMVRNKDVGVFCNMAGATLSNAETFAQCIDFLEANRALAPSFVLEFKQNVFRNLGPIESEHLAALAQRGYRFSIDHVTDLRIEPRDLADRGVRFIKVPAALLLDPKQTSNSDIHPADLSDLLGRFGIDLIAERIEGERAVVDLLDFDVRFGQGFLFAAPRPLRPETPANGGAPNPAIKEPARASTDPNGPVRSAPTTPPRPEPPRSTGNAALARRATGPN